MRLKMLVYVAIMTMSTEIMVVDALQFGLSGKRSASFSISPPLPITTTTIPSPPLIPSTHDMDILRDFDDMSSSSSSARSRKNSSITIRTTRRADLDSIIDLLAYEGNAPTNNGGLLTRSMGMNWNAGIQMLKRKQSLKAQLIPRIDACETAAAVAISCSCSDSDEIRDQNQHRHQILWGNESFRNKVQKAVYQTQEYNSEGTAWDDHNFALTPEPWMLQHFFLTAVDRDFVGNSNGDGNSNNDESAEVAGFCEVGLLPNPLYIDTENDDDATITTTTCTSIETMGKFIPCIGNLVVSPNQRRRGIAGRLVQSAIRLAKVYNVQYDGGSSTGIGTDTDAGTPIMGLWVEENNTAAIRLYEKLGFRHIHTESKMSSSSSSTSTGKQAKSTMFMYIDLNSNRHMNGPTSNANIQHEIYQ